MAGGTGKGSRRLTILEAIAEDLDEFGDFPPGIRPRLEVPLSWRQLGLWVVDVLGLGVWEEDLRLVELVEPCEKGKMGGDERDRGFHRSQ